MNIYIHTFLFSTYIYTYTYNRHIISHAWRQQQPIPKAIASMSMYGRGWSPPSV